MAWGRMDDQMSDHPKIIAAGNAATGAWVRLLSWSNRYGTDGLVPTHVLRGYATRTETARLLSLGPSGAPLLHGPGDQCRCLVTGQPVPARTYALHDFDDYNELAAELRLRAARRAELRDPALRLAVRNRDRDLCRYCAVACTVTGPRRLELDHIDPRVAHGAVNLVVACHACNAGKGNRTPDEAGMTLLPVPSSELSDGRSTMDSHAAGHGAGTRLAHDAHTRARGGYAGPDGIRVREAVADRRDHGDQPHWRTQRAPDDQVPDWPPVDAEVIP